MPTVILDRIPLPNLRLYTSLSVVLVSCCLYYAIVATNDPNWRLVNNMPVAKDAAADASAEVAGAASTSETVDALAAKLVGSAENEVESRVDDANRVLDDAVVVAAKTVLHDKEAVMADERGYMDQLRDVTSFMCQEPFCIWVSSFVEMCIIAQDKRRQTKRMLLILIILSEAQIDYDPFLHHALCPNWATMRLTVIIINQFVTGHCSIFMGDRCSSLYA